MKYWKYSHIFYKANFYKFYRHEFHLAALTSIPHLTEPPISRRKVHDRRLRHEPFLFHLHLDCSSYLQFFLFLLNAMPANSPPDTIMDTRYQIGRAHV